MPEFGNDPAVGRVALRTVVAKQAEVAVVVGVAGGAVQHSFFHPDPFVRRRCFVHPSEEGCTDSSALAVCCGRPQLSQPETHQGSVVHHGRALSRTAVLRVARFATRDVGVEGSGLAL